MNRRPFKAVRVVQLGAGLIGKCLAPLVAVLPNVRRIVVVDRDTYTAGQAAHPSQAGRAKAEVAAENMRALNRRLIVRPVIADIENLPLGLFCCDILLTALDSNLARIMANFAFRKLRIPYWVDAGVSAPWLVRVSTFAYGTKAPCFECSLDAVTYASEESYPCQGPYTPPPTQSPAFLGSLAASLQAAECARLLTGECEQSTLNRELVYDVSSGNLFATRLTRRDSCRLDHRAFSIRPLRRSPAQITLAQAFALQSGGTNGKSTAATTLEVPGKLFVRELACPCGHRRAVLRLKGRFSVSALTCARCGGRMAPAGKGLSNVLALGSLLARELAKPLTALGLQPADVISVGNGHHANLFQLSH